MSWIYFVDLFGTCIFAISGVLTAKQKNFDLVGTLVVGFVTSIGGGTLRDLLIDKHPVSWLNDRSYFLVIILGYFIAYIFKNRIINLKKSMFLFDTIGIGLFTVLGIQAAMQKGFNVEICLIMGIISACFGGILRDVLTNEIPLIFRKEIYASACLIGGLVYVGLTHLSNYENINTLVPIFTVIVIRYCSIKYNWTLNFKITN